VVPRAALRPAPIEILQVPEPGPVAVGSAEGGGACGSTL